MEHHSKSRVAFTLIEMLVVIAIIGFLAAALVAGLKTAQRTARSALCQARMKNLHQACMNYLSDLHDNDHYYPYAGSYEWFYTVYSTYHENKGWVAWIREDGKSADDVPSPWKEDNKESHAKDYLHAGWGGEMAERSIREGSIFKYTSRDTSTFFCKQFNDGKGDVRRSYAMNKWFGSRRNELWRGRRLIDFQNYGKEPSRMGYIIELSSTATANHPGEKGGDKVGARKPIAEDSVWEYDDDDIDNDDADDERYGLWHRKAGQMHGHVIFVDGHIESLYQSNKQGDDHETQNEKIGNATH